MSKRGDDALRAEAEQVLPELTAKLKQIDTDRDAILAEREEAWQRYRCVLTDTAIAKLSEVSPARVTQRLGVRG